MIDLICNILVIILLVSLLVVLRKTNFIERNALLKSKRIVSVSLMIFTISAIISIFFPEIQGYQQLDTKTIIVILVKFGLLFFTRLMLNKENFLQGNQLRNTRIVICITLISFFYPTLFLLVMAIGGVG